MICARVRVPFLAEEGRSMNDRTFTGRCLCGAVRFKLKPPIRDVIICHCRQCARWTGYAVAATAVSVGNFELLAGDDVLTWHASSEQAQRGFCATCGSSLFWKPSDGTRISVLAGSLDPPTGLAVTAHIFTESKSDYYEISGDALQCAFGAGELAHRPGR
jgi:hypothetical protein